MRPVASILLWITIILFNHPSKATAQDVAGRAPKAKADVVTEMPGPIQAVSVARGGKSLVLKLGGIPGLGVYDADEKKLVKILPLPSSDFMFSAGGERAVVYFKENNIFQVWNLITFEKEKTKPNPLTGTVLRMAMGYSRDDVALVRNCDETDGYHVSNGRIYLLDTRTLQPNRKEKEVYYLPEGQGSHRSDMFIRASKDLELVAEWSYGGGSPAAAVWVRSGDAYQPQRTSNYGGHIVFGDDGRAYCGDGEIRSRDFVSIGKIANRLLYPGIGGSLVLSMNDKGQLTLFEAGKTTPLGPWGAFPGWDKKKYEESRGNYDVFIDQRIVPDPARGRVLFIPFENNRIVQRPFDLKQALDASGVDYLVITSIPDSKVKVETKWTYEIKVLSKAGDVKFQIELGPKGMTVSETGLVTWKPPASATGSEKVLLLISDGGGEQTYHSFTLDLVNGTEKSRPDDEGDSGEEERRPDRTRDDKAKEEETLRVESTPQTDVRSGEAWEYSVRVTSETGARGLTYKLVMAPKGMRVSSDGLLTWKVPTKKKYGKNRVKLLITDENGARVVHDFILTIQPSKGN